MHVMIDEPEDDMDIQIATHIVKVHQRQERAFNVPYTMAQVQRYIRYARSITPQISAQVGLLTKSHGAEAVTHIHDNCAKGLSQFVLHVQLAQNLPAQAANAKDCKASSTANAAYHTSRTFKLIAGQGCFGEQLHTATRW